MRTTETSALGAEATAKRIIERLRKEGVIPSPIPSKADSCGAFIEAFVVFLQQHRGLRSTSLAASRRWARIFADYAGLRSRACIRALGQKQVEGFVIEFLSGVGRGTRVNVTCILRRFLRYLRLAGLTSEELARFVPKVRTYRLQRVPKTLSDREVKNLLKSFDRKTAAGKRNYAMVLLIATYGMRPSDVIRLKLENIDWGRGQISLVQAKTDRPLKLPLLDDVGRAIVDYLKYGRPKTACREIFLAVVAPTAPLEAPSAVTTLVRSYLRKIGIAEPRGGCRALRHTTGKRMIVSGVPLKVIGDTLGHKSTEATYVYTKVDVPALKGVCLDPP